jgi:hypothetical protein
MGIRFSKSIKFGPIKTTISRKGIGKSIGFLGFRFGISAEGKRYWSFGIRGTGLYYIKYY